MHPLRRRPHMLDQHILPAHQMPRLGQRAEDRVNGRDILRQPVQDQPRRFQLPSQGAAPRIQHAQRRPVQSAVHHMPGVLARPFQVAGPPILDAVVGQAEAAGRGDLDEVPVISLLEFQC